MGFRLPENSSLDTAQSSQHQSVGEAKIVNEIESYIPVRGLVTPGGLKHRSYQFTDKLHPANMAFATS